MSPAGASSTSPHFKSPMGRQAIARCVSAGCDVPKNATSPDGAAQYEHGWTGVWGGVELAPPGLGQAVGLLEVIQHEDGAGCEQATPEFVVFEDVALLTLERCIDEH